MVKKLDEKSIKIASRMSLGGFSYKKIGEFLNVTEQTITAWAKTEIWKTEQESYRELKHDLILKSSDPGLISKFEYWNQKFLENAHNYQLLQQQIIKKLAVKLAENKSKSDNFNEERNMIQGLASMDNLIHDNIEKCLLLDEIVDYINGQN